MQGTVLDTVVRGPVPRVVHRHDVYSPSVVCNRLITNGSRSGDLDLQGLARERWRGTGFPTALREGAAFFIVARGLSPRR